MDNLDLNEIRLLYKHAADNSRKCEKLYDLLNAPEVEQYPILLGYKGATQAIRAKHSLFPHLKYSRFKEAIQIIERSIIKDDESVELRFLRFTIQSNSPALFNYKGKIKEDKQLITEALPHLSEDEGLTEAIATALLTSDTSTKADKELAKQYLSEE